MINNKKLHKVNISKKLSHHSNKFKPNNRKNNINIMIIWQIL
jgi:hypothetical protein